MTFIEELREATEKHYPELELKRENQAKALCERIKEVLKQTANEGYSGHTFCMAQEEELFGDSDSASINLMKKMFEDEGFNVSDFMGHLTISWKEKEDKEDEDDD